MLEICSSRHPLTWASYAAKWSYSADRIISCWAEQAEAPPGRSCSQATSTRNIHTYQVSIRTQR